MTHHKKLKDKVHALIDKLNKKKDLYIEVLESTW